MKSCSFRGLDTFVAHDNTVLLTEVCDLVSQLRLRNEILADFALKTYHFKGRKKIRSKYLKEFLKEFLKVSSFLFSLIFISFCCLHSGAEVRFRFAARIRLPSQPRAYD